MIDDIKGNETDPFLSPPLDVIFGIIGTMQEAWCTR